MSTDDPTLPGAPHTRRSSTDVAVRRGMSVGSLRAIEQIEPALREHRQADRAIVKERSHP